MRSAVDTNVLLDLLGGDLSLSASSRQALEEAMRLGPVLICPVVYAELAAGFSRREDLMRYVAELQLQVDGFSGDALLSAADAWRRYVTRRGQASQCPRCGQKAALACPSCGAPMVWRQHVIADFLVGAHASQQADCLLTRDAGYFRNHFPDLRLVVP